MSGHRLFEDFKNACRTHAHLDPGDAGTITGDTVGYLPLVTGGAETRTLADPDARGGLLILTLLTDGGDCVVTASTAINATGNTIITFADAGDTCLLVSSETAAGTYVWRYLAGDGGGPALS